MKGDNRLKGVAKVVFLFIFILALAGGGLVWLDFLGILEIKDQLAVVTRYLGIRPRDPVPEMSQGLFDADRMAKERQALLIQRQELENYEAGLILRENELAQKEGDVQEREQALEEQQKSLSEALRQYENKLRNLEQTARYLGSMPPPDAVAILDEMEVNDVVDLLRVSENLSQQADEASLVAYWLSLMEDRKRSAEIQRKMVIKPRLSLGD